MTTPLPGQGGRVRMRLLKTHTHASREHQPGDEIDVVLLVAEWLRTHEVGEPASPVPAAPPAAAPSPAPSAAPVASPVPKA